MTAVMSKLQAAARELRDTADNLSEFPDTNADGKQFWAAVFQERLFAAATAADNLAALIYLPKDGSSHSRQLEARKKLVSELSLLGVLVSSRNDRPLNDKTRAIESGLGTSWQAVSEVKV